MGEAVLHKYLKEDTSEELCGFGRKYPEHPKNTAFNSITHWMEYPESKKHENK